VIALSSTGKGKKLSTSVMLCLTLYLFSSVTIVGLSSTSIEVLSDFWLRLLCRKQNTQKSKVATAAPVITQVMAIPAAAPPDTELLFDLTAEDLAGDILASEGLVDEELDGEVLAGKD